MLRVLRRSVLVAVAAVAVAGCGGGTQASNTNLATAVSGTQASAKSGSARVGQVLFSRSANLYVVALDGSKARLFLAHASSAAVSRDGSRIAFVRGGELWTMRRDRSGQRQVTVRPRGWDAAAAPAWAPDGRTLYFVRSHETAASRVSPAVFSIHTDGTALRRLTTGGCEFAPAPSPDGRIVAYTWISGMRTLDCVEGAEGSIDAVTPAGRRANLPFTFPDWWTYEPAWSPDGRLLAYTEINPDTSVWSIYISASDGSPPRRLPTPKQNTVGAPAWSPDGKWIAFTIDREVLWVIHRQILVVRQDGTHLHQIPHTGSPDDGGPAWLEAPD